MITRPDNDPRLARRNAVAVRAVTAVVALGLVALALVELRGAHGTGALGWAHWALLAVAVAVGALGILPISWNQNGLLVAAAFGLALVLAEFLLRATVRPWFEPIYEPDTRVLYRHIPGAERAYNYGGTVIRYKIDSRGFRGGELAPPGTVPRVLVYGDSFIQGDFSPTEDTFTEQLRTRLARMEGRAVDVVNAGVAGYGPDQELRRMEDELSVIQPNLVIVALYAGNDFGDLLRDKLYKLAQDGLLHDNPSVVLDEVLASNMRRARTEPILVRILRSERNRLLPVAGMNIKTGREARRARVEADLQKGYDEYRQYMVDGDNVVHDLLMDPYNADVSLTPQSPSAQYQVAMMEQIMRRMAETAAKNNVPLVFMLIPSPIDATDGHEVGEVDPLKYPQYKRSALTDVLEQICQKNGFRELNLFDSFWQQRADRLYLGGLDDHWNARGEAYAAELMAEFLRSQKLLDIPNADHTP